MAWAMLDRHKASVPHEAVAADDEFGRVEAFRAGLREQGEAYALDVPCSTPVRDLQARRPRSKPPAASHPGPTRAIFPERFDAEFRQRKAVPLPLDRRVTVRKLPVLRPDEFLYPTPFVDGTGYTGQGCRSFGPPPAAFSLRPSQSQSRTPVVPAAYIG